MIVGSSVLVFCIFWLSIPSKPSIAKPQIAKLWFKVEFDAKDLSRFSWPPQGNPHNGNVY